MTEITGETLSAWVVSAAEHRGWQVAAVQGVVGDERHFVMTPAADGPAVDHAVVVSIHSAAATVTCHSIAPRRCDAESAPAVMEFLTRANSGLIEGNFELDLDDGEVRFTTSFHVVEGDNGAKIDAAFEHALAFNLTVFGLYRDGLERSIDGSATPAEAVAAAESLHRPLDEPDSDV